MDKEVDNDKNLSNIQDSFDQKIKLFQKEITNKLEQKYKENCSSLELKIQKIEEENKEKITTLEQMISDLEKIIHQKDEKINSLDCEIKQVDLNTVFLQFWQKFPQKGKFCIIGN